MNSVQRAHRVRVLAGFAVGATLPLIVVGLWLVAPQATSWPDAMSRMLLERRGQEVYNAYCVSCHLGPTGGRIDDDPPRHNANGHTWHHPDCALKRMTREGSEALRGAAPPGGLPMPAFKDRLSLGDIDAALAYIKTMWTPGQRQLQESFTQQMCFEGTG